MCSHTKSKHFKRPNRSLSIAIVYCGPESRSFLCFSLRFTTAVNSRLILSGTQVLYCSWRSWFHIGTKKPWNLFFFYLSLTFVCPFSVMLFGRLTSGFGWYSADARKKQSKNSHLTSVTRVNYALQHDDTYSTLTWWSKKARQERWCQIFPRRISCVVQIPLTQFCCGDGCGWDRSPPPWLRIEACLPGLWPHQ